MWFNWCTSVWWWFFSNIGLLWKVIVMRESFFIKTLLIFVRKWTIWSRSTVHRNRIAEFPTWFPHVCAIENERVFVWMLCSTVDNRSSGFSELSPGWKLFHKLCALLHIRALMFPVFSFKCNMHWGWTFHAPKTGNSDTVFSRSAFFEKRLSCLFEF